MIPALVQSTYSRVNRNEQNLFKIVSIWLQALGRNHAQHTILQNPQNEISDSQKFVCIHWPQNPAPYLKIFLNIKFMKQPLQPVFWKDYCELFRLFTKYLLKQMRNLSNFFYVSAQVNIKQPGVKLYLHEIYINFQVICIFFNNVLRFCYTCSITL